MKTKLRASCHKCSLNIVLRTLLVDGGTDKITNAHTKLMPIESILVDGLRLIDCNILKTRVSDIFVPPSKTMLDKFDESLRLFLLVVRRIKWDKFYIKIKKILILTIDINDRNSSSLGWKVGYAYFVFHCGHIKSSCFIYVWL